MGVVCFGKLSVKHGAGLLDNLRCVPDNLLFVPRNVLWQGAFATFVQIYAPGRSVVHTL